MPSGAKKRKAAKKKKKEIQHNPSSTLTRGDADADGRESEVSSPASQDRRNASSGGEEETEGETSIPARAAAADEPRDVVMEDSDQKLEGDEIPIKRGEGGSSRGSSTTGSDDETSFEEMKYRRAENAPPREELPEGEKTKPDVASRDYNNNNCVEEESERKENEEKSITARVEGVSVISDTVDECLSVSNNIPVASGDDHERDSGGVSEPLLGSAPRREQTSWKGCCGLLEVFTGSGR